MLLLIAAASQPPLPPVRVQATASVRIERPVAVSSKDWNDAPEARRREIVVRDEAGQTLLLRLIENE